MNGVWVDTAGKIELTTIGPFAVSGASGDASDILAWTLGSPGSTTPCTWAMSWGGSANGFAGEVTDSVCIIPQDGDTVMM